MSAEAGKPLARSDRQYAEQFEQLYYTKTIENLRAIFLKFEFPSDHLDHLFENEDSWQGRTNIARNHGFRHER